MSDMEISTTEIDVLAGKLAALALGLSEREQALLATVFTVARDAIGRSTHTPAPLSAFMPQVESTGEQDDTARFSVHDQFLDAFSPGRDDQSTTVPDKVGNLQFGVPEGGAGRDDR